VTDTISKANAVLTVEQMYAADAAAMTFGVPSLALMEAAGTHVARVIRGRWNKGRVVVLCGPGNNGGDGFVAARLLRQAGWPVRLGLLGDVSALKGDAATNATRWASCGGKTEPLCTELVDWADLALDALFGAGLSRALDGPARDVVGAVNAAALPCVAVDMPSGVSGDTGAVVGAVGQGGIAIDADVTVTFFRRKPGHVVLPGRDLCGAVELCDIGIPAAVLDDIKPGIEVNRPSESGGTWRIRQPASGDHKYARGHAVIFGSERMSGAARLAAAAARRIGAGLVTVAAPKIVRPIYLGDAPGLMFHVTDEDGTADVLFDPRRNAVAIGPGYGVGQTTRERVLEVLAAGRATVLDADALSSFKGHADTLFAAIEQCPGGAVLTPHVGEFERLFGSDGGDDRVTRALKAAAISGAVIVLKGSDTVIASPAGVASVSDNAPPGLATAGSGDVLTGLITGLLAQGLSPWDAARAGVWVHGAAAGDGIGLIAEDLIAAIPDVLRGLWSG
jgi:hydroxyethylthiazole kinase-like uncharacterized protein yjeF